MHSYYHYRINQVFTFLTAPQKRVLYYGDFGEDIISRLKASNYVIVSQGIKELGYANFLNSPSIQLIDMAYEEYEPAQEFDYIILDGTIGETADVCKLLQNVRLASRASTRIIIYQHNYIWQGILNLAEILKLKRKDKAQNWLSIRDLKSCLIGMGFQPIRTFRRTICPVKIGFIGPLLNVLTDIIPLFDFLKLDQFIVARPIVFEETTKRQPKSLTICITVRDEKDCILPIVQSIEKICDEQEILFVEGHSCDGTKEEILRVASLHPEKNVRLILQPGNGQGDAIREGFKEARGNIIILYEGDGTSNPEDIKYFYKMMQSGRFEFIAGSRFIYPLSPLSMPFLKKAGNIFFARWFSWFLGQHVTDVLSGIKAITKEEYNLIFDHWGLLGINDPFGDFELLYGSFRFGLKFCEIPMHYKPRKYGRSKTGIFKHGLPLLKMAAKGYYVFRSAFTSGGFNK